MSGHDASPPHAWDLILQAQVTVVAMPDERGRERVSCQPGGITGAATSPTMDDVGLYAVYRNTADAVAVQCSTEYSAEVQQQPVCNSEKRGLWW